MYKINSSWSMAHGILSKIDQNKRTEEVALTMTEPVGSVALAHHNILVSAVKLIDVIFMNVKIMGTVLLLLSMAFQHQNVNVLEIMVGQLVTLTYA